MDPIVTSHLQTIEQLKWFTDMILKGDIPEAARFYQTAPGTAHIHWLIGHVGFAIDRISLPGLEGPSALPDSLQPVFGWGTKPVPDRSVYPGWEETVGDLYGAIERLRSHVAGLTDRDLARPLPQGHPFGKRMPNQGAMVPFTGYHTCYHLGQVSLLRRAQGLPAGTQV